MMIELVFWEDGSELAYMLINLQAYMQVNYVDMMREG